mmetsp:Transcript_19296/g.32351  ORF Transcript_19296/g.32351 Transcript_19296/m.32351 type:complete len:92 (+) Transcript_19296:200-475(+)
MRCQCSNTNNSSSNDGSVVGVAGCSSVVRLAVQRTELEILLGGFLDDTWETIHSAVEEYLRSDRTASEGSGTWWCARLQLPILCPCSSGRY